MDHIRSRCADDGRGDMDPQSEYQDIASVIEWAIHMLGKPIVLEHLRVDSIWLKDLRTGYVVADAGVIEALFRLVQIANESGFGEPPPPTVISAPVVGPAASENVMHGEPAPPQAASIQPVDEPMLGIALALTTLLNHRREGPVGLRHLENMLHEVKTNNAGKTRNEWQAWNREIAIPCIEVTMVDLFGDFPPFNSRCVDLARNRHRGARSASGS